MAKRLIIPLIAALLIIALVVPGCEGEGETYALTIAVDPPGSGTATFTGTSPFAPLAVIPVDATANTGYEFFRWTATAGFFDDEFSASTNFNMPGEAATVTANFREVRTEGFWLDEIYIEYEPDDTVAVNRLIDNEFDVFAYSLDRADLFALVQADPDVTYKPSIGSWKSLRINPYGPEFTDGTLNPFYFNVMDLPEGTRTLQEVLHKFIDLDYLINDPSINGGLGWPRVTSQHSELADYDRYKDDTYIALESSINYLEDMYDYDETEGATWLADTMAEINNITGNITGDQTTGWLYKGEPIEFTMAITSDDPARNNIGNYVGAQLEAMGFAVEYVYGDMAAMLSGLANVEEDTTGGNWNIYTGGWVSTVLSRDEGFWFVYFHTDLWSAGIPAFEWLRYPAEFYDDAFDLAFLLFGSFTERDALYESVLPQHMKWGMYYLLSDQGFSPLRTNVDLASDGAGGIYGSWTWALTAHFRDSGGTPIFGGNMRIAQHDMLVEPWNPVDGSNAVYDMFPIRATGDEGHLPDPRDGLRQPSRITDAEVTITTGLPAIATNSWVTLSFDDPITCPGDYWRSWNYTTGLPNTVTDALANPWTEWGLDTAVCDRYSVVDYPEEIWDVPWHDGSTMSFADFLYYWTINYDRGLGEGVNPMYDEAHANELAGEELGTTLGVKFEVNPEAGVGLRVHVYSDLWELDAERMCDDYFPNYEQGTGAWHTVALGILGERDGSMAFGEVKAQPLALGWINFLNRSIQQSELLGFMDGIIAQDPLTYDDASVPYFEFIEAEYTTQGLGDFADEVGPRMSNLSDFVDAYNHLWVGCGPYYLYDYNFALNWVTLKAHETYPDDPSKWFTLLGGLPLPTNP
jgi:peptide/nickel transport system substrate-binding protein